MDGGGADGRGGKQDRAEVPGGGRRDAKAAEANREFAVLELEFVLGEGTGGNDGGLVEEEASRRDGGGDLAEAGGCKRCGLIGERAGAEFPRFGGGRFHPGAKLDELAAGAEGDSGAGVADAIGGEDAKNAAGGDGLASVRLHQNRLIAQENMGGSAGGGGVGGGFEKPARKEEEGEQVVKSRRREEILFCCPPDVVVF